MISASGACRRGGPAVYFIKSCAIENIPVRTTMKLHVDSGGRRLDIDAPPGRHLSESLAEAGIRLDLRCGGNNRCGRCRVRLLSGRFAIAGKAYDADREGPREGERLPAHPGRSRGTDRNSGFLAVPGRPADRNRLPRAPSGAASGPGETAPRLRHRHNHGGGRPRQGRRSAPHRRSAERPEPVRRQRHRPDRRRPADRRKRQPSFAAFSSKRP